MLFSMMMLIEMVHEALGRRRPQNTRRGRSILLGSRPSEAGESETVRFTPTTALVLGKNCPENTFLHRNVAKSLQKGCPGVSIVIVSGLLIPLGLLLMEERLSKKKGRSCAAH
jgi:hypothetical protein